MEACASVWWQDVVLRPCVLAGPRRDLSRCRMLMCVDKGEPVTSQVTWGGSNQS